MSQVSQVISTMSQLQILVKIQSRALHILLSFFNSMRKSEWIFLHPDEIFGTYQSSRQKSTGFLLFNNNTLQKSILQAYMYPALSVENSFLHRGKQHLSSKRNQNRWNWVAETSTRTDSVETAISRNAPRVEIFF